MIPFSLSTHRRTLSLVIAVGAVALATVVAVGSTVPALDPMPLMDGGLTWTSSVRHLSTQRAAAIGDLLMWLRIAAWATVLVGVISLLAVSGHIAATTGSELVIHRAVGASRRELRRRAIGGGALIAGLAIGVGLVLGAVGAVAGERTWPGPGFGWQWTATIPVLVVGAAVLLGALFPLTALRARRLAEPPAAVAPLTIPALQLGLALTIIVAGAMVIRQVTPAAEAGTNTPLSGGWIAEAQAGGDLPRRAARYDSLLRRLREAGSSLVSLTNVGGHLGLGTVDRLSTECGQCYVGGIFLKWRDLDATYHTVSADTFQARGVRVVEGRGFTAADRLEGQPVAVVNLHLARRYFESGQALGHAVFPGGRLGGTAYRVVGVVDDGGVEGLGGGQGPLERIYLSSLQHPATRMEVWTSSRATSPFISAPKAFPTYLAAEHRPLQWFGRWFAVVGLVTLLLGSAGTGALLWLWVLALRPELGIRRAVGARRGQILLFLMGPACRTGLAGGAAGLIFFGPVLWPEISRLAPGIPWWQPGLVWPVAALLVVVAAVGALVPGLAATRASCTDLWAEP